jgi:hypothetical protein
MGGKQRKIESRGDENSTERRMVRADAGEMLVFRYDAEVRKGALSIQIEDPDGVPLWGVSLEQDAEDTASVQVGQEGNHAIVVQGASTCGGFDLS